VDGQTIVAYDVAIMSVLFKRPAGYLAISVEEFVKEPIKSVSFLNEEVIVEVDERVVIEVADDELDWNRLRDTRDDYESLLVSPEREIIYKDGEYKLGIPSVSQKVSDEPIENLEDID